MADSSALYGLAGVLGGAAVGGLAAVFGPILLHRRQTSRQTAEQEITRLLRMRTTGRSWLDALERAVQDLQAGRSIDIDRFDEIVGQSSRDATEASHSLAHGGVWLESMDTDPRGVQVPAEFAAHSQLLGRLREATREVRAAILQGSVQSDGAAHLLGALETAQSARAQLNSALLEQIEKVNGRPMRRA